MYLIPLSRDLGQHVDLLVAWHRHRHHFLLNVITGIVRRLAQLDPARHPVGVVVPEWRQCRHGQCLGQVLEEEKPAVTVFIVEGRETRDLALLPVTEQSQSARRARHAPV